MVEFKKIELWLMEPEQLLHTTTVSSLYEWCTVTKVLAGHFAAWKCCKSNATKEIKELEQGFLPHTAYSSDYQLFCSRQNSLSQQFKQV